MAEAFRGTSRSRAGWPRTAEPNEGNAPEHIVSLSAPLRRDTIRRRGVSLDDVGFVLRHADKRTTERVYAHTRLFDVRDRMAEKGALQ